MSGEVLFDSLQIRRDALHQFPVLYLLPQFGGLMRLVQLADSCLAGFLPLPLSLLVLANLV